MNMKTKLWTATALAVACSAWLGCRAPLAPKPEAQSRLMELLKDRDTKTVDLAQVGVSQYGKPAAAKTVSDTWSKLTNGERTERAGDVMWLMQQTPRVRDVAWLLHYQAEWLK
jgi:hypothetical protein